MVSNGAKRRARSEQAKQERAARIVAAARELQAARPFGELRMAEIAQHAGLAKGTLFLYFATKEGLGLALTEALLDDWLAAVAQALAGLPVAADPRRVATLIADSVAQRPALIRMLALLGPLLESNIPPDTALAWKQRLLARLDELGSALERVLPFLAPGAGARALLLINALVVGLQQMAEPPTAVREALRRPELERLTIDMHTELANALSAYFRGLESEALGEI